MFTVLSRDGGGKAKIHQTQKNSSAGITLLGRTKPKNKDSSVVVQ
jgi:hypothetical protein